MATPILMPRQGNTVEECLLAAWKKRKGEKITKGEIIADIETDKATFELEAPADGVLLETFFEAGILVPVMTNIGVVGAEGEDVSQFKPKSEVKISETTAAIATQERTADIKEASPTNSSTATTGKLSPRAKRFIERHQVGNIPLSGSGPDGRIMESDIRQIRTESSHISPVAAMLAKEGWRIPDSGSGTNGLIRKGDLLPPGKPLAGIRAIIASRMKESLSSSAQYTVSIKTPAASLIGFRKKVKLSFNDLVNFAAIKTVLQFPEMNAELIDGVLYTYNHVNLAFACDTPKGLLVPVIKRADSLSLEKLAAETKRLSYLAQEGKILPDDLSGGTFTVSNLGMFGVTEFTPVLNIPQTAILGVCAISLEAVRSSDGTIIFEDRIGFSLTSDHQVVDGAMAARFLKKLSETISNIESECGLATK